jgi:hypothetical protein
MKKRILTLLILICACCVYGQDYKIGKVSKEELQEKVHPLDASADAAYLYKNRKTYFDYIQGEGFVVITKVHERIKIYNKKGYEWATKSIKYYAPEGSDSEKVSVKDAKTYSIVEGKVQSAKLEKKEIFDEKSNKYWKKKKFTMPNIIEGCIVEWEYTIRSPYKGIDDVVLQHSIPIKRLESSIETPEYYQYKTRYNGYLKIKELPEVKNKSINISQRSRTGGGTLGPGIQTQYSNQKVEYKSNIIKIDKQNIPALVEEPYINNINNYRSSIDFELATVRWPNQHVKHFSQTWEDVAKTVRNNPDFGGELKKTGHLSDEMDILKGELTTESSKIFGALQYVKNKIKWNDYNGKSTEKGLRKAYKEGTGNIADINLTLVAVLRELGINANPVLVSTRSHGVPTFPTLSGFNYVIAVAETSSGKILLDASEKYSLPNVLPLRTMNWNGVIVRDDETTDFVNLGSSITSIEETNLSYKILDDGSIEGMNRIKYKNYASLSYRNNFGSNKEEDIINKVEEKNDIEILNFRVSNLNDISKPLAEVYKFESEGGVEIIGGKMYVTPLLFNATVENPFKIENREYPIDFGSPYEEKVNISFQIPEGYKIESLPEDIAKGMSDDLGTFIYSVKNQGGKIQIVSNIKINNGIIPATHYAEIKEMFKQIVSKQTEKIILSK